MQTSETHAALAYEVGSVFAERKSCERRETMLLVHKRNGMYYGEVYAYHYFDGFPGWWCWLRDCADELDRLWNADEQSDDYDWIRLIDTAAELVAYAFEREVCPIAEDVASAAMKSESTRPD